MKANVLPVEEMIELEKTLEINVKILILAAVEKFGSAQVKKLRDDYKKDKNILWANPQAKKSMEWIISKEETLILSCINISADLCKHFSNIDTELTSDECRNEAAMAIYDGLYGYNGLNRLSTYIHMIIKNRLLDIVRLKNRKKRSLDKNIRLAKSKVSEVLTSSRGLKEAISFSGISEIIDLNWLMKKGDFKDKFQEEKIEDLNSAIKNVDLTENEKKVIESFLDGSKVSQIEIESSVGEKLSPQRLQQIFKSGCLKIKNKMLEVA